MTAMSASANSLGILTDLSRTLNPHGADGISQYVTSFDFDQHWADLKSDPAAADSVQFFETDPPSFRIGGVSYYRGGDNPESQ